MKAFSNGALISRKVALVNIVLVADAFIWYFYVFNFLSDIAVTDNLLILGVNFLGIAVSAILSSFFIDRFKQRLRFLRYWMLAGVFLSFAPIIINFAPYIGLIVISAVLGMYFGFGMPVCMGYYSATTETGNRGKIGGITVLLIGLGSFLFSNIGRGDANLTALILAMLRAIGLILLVFLKPDEKQVDKNKVSYSTVISNRTFLLYFVPWCMFSLVNDMTFPVKSNFFTADFVYYSGIIGNVLAGIFALVGGFFADSVGRKRLAVAGFAILGLGYAALGLSSQGNLFGWWFYTVVDGIAWGAFYTIFLVTIWGDLAHERNSEKYYAIGSLPYLLSNFTRLTLGSYVSNEIPTYAVFSFASLFLFLAVLPLVFAPETLPEKTIRERELKGYIEKAKKAKGKYA